MRIQKIIIGVCGYIHISIIILFKPQFSSINLLVMFTCIYIV